jgi:cell division protein FtsN
MAARKGKQATRGSELSPSWPAWVWLGLGVLLGLAMSAIVLIKDWAPALRKKNIPQPNAEATAPRESEPAVADDKSKAGRKSYDFYSVLPEMEVVIPDAELSARARAEAAKRQQAATQTPATTATPPIADAAMHYVLQAGSYPEAKDAEAVKARLALLGVQAKVQVVTVNNKTWHRVRVGPYSSAGELEQAKQTLAENGIAAIAMKETAAQ